MAKKIILEDSQGNVLHPKTLGECVTTETGETVDGLVSKSQMFSPIIETDSSMSKVGVGTDIDVSLNVKDGAYEECVFEGRSLVNHVRLNNRITSKAAIEIEGQPIDHTKAYLLKVRINEVPVFTSESDSQLALKIQYFHTGSTKGFISIPNSSMVKGYELTKVVTPVSDSDTNKKFVLWMPRYVSGTLDVDVMFIPYQEGMENWDIPYFEGLCDVQMPILRNVGKNLFDGNFVYSTYVSGHPVIYDNNQPVTFPYTTSSSNRGVGFVVKVKPNTQYTMSIDNNIENGVFVGAGYSSITDIGRQSRALFYIGNVSNTDVSVRTFTTTNECHYVVIGNYINYNYEVTGGSITFNEPPRIQLEESSTLTVYEPYKTNILHTSEEIVLRSVGDIKDSYNALTGEYTKRIEEITFNGSENEWEDWNENSFVLRGSYFSDAIEHSSSTAPRLKCNNMVAGLGETPRTVRYYKTPTVLWTMVGKNDGETLDQFKQWLSQNPATIQYILAEPVTTIVKPSTIPFAYANGHMVLESGSSEQSLLPHLKYSVVTGRTGQVTQNAKVLRKQEQQIIGLEELLLTQIVQMEYERTLLQFDYELQMMMLG